MYTEDTHFAEVLILNYYDMNILLKNFSESQSFILRTIYPAIFRAFTSSPMDIFSIGHFIDRTFLRYRIHFIQYNFNASQLIYQIIYQIIFRITKQLLLRFYHAKNIRRLFINYINVSETIK